MSSLCNIVLDNPLSNNPQNENADNLCGCSKI